MQNVISLAIMVLLFYSMWKVFVKAGQPGWAAIVPIYNAIIMLRIAGKPDWWVILFLVPLVNIVIAIIAYMAFAEKFGKSAGFGIGLALLGIVFFPILAFSDAKYIGGPTNTPPPLPQ
jgi:hypothetical protein